MSDEKARETSLWNWLYEGSKKINRPLQLERIENLVGVGTPDVQGFLGQQFWCELKSIARTDSLDCEVSSDQVRWHRQRWRVGGTSWFLIQVGSGHKAFRFLIPGYRALALQDRVAIKVLKSWSVMNPSEKASNCLKMMGN